MIDFSRRSREAEQIDFPDTISPKETETTLRELRLVNRWLGGVKTCLDALKPLLSRLAEGSPGRTLRVVDFGAGGADIPIAVVDWARRKGWPIRVVAVDFNPVACRFARAATAAHPEIEVVRADVFRDCLRPGAFDVAVFSAFLHHFTESEISEILSRCGSTVASAIVVNDLQRSRLAYFGIRLLTRFLSHSEAVKNDGPLSVLKGFRRHELRQILSRSGFSNARIAWRWAFRYAVTIPLDEAR